ncbi:MAG: type III-B CRISPR module RAMP protein Cmr1 [Rubrobacter sp.]|nr:type III-B CRISPR module RAMP protein Cmr1 [Rubrobacter sp.]
MNKLFVEMKLVSPAFVGGADQDRAELRVASLRGLLRFWWRATQPPMSARELLRKESDLFGSTETGQSKFLMRIMEDKTRPLPAGATVNNSIGYLGYGIAEYKRDNRRVETIRDALDAGSKFTLQLLFKKGADKHENELLDALWCLTHLGGMGSRSRRGFGSMVVTGVEGADFPGLPRSPEDLKERIEEKFEGLSVCERAGLPEYTALSRHAAVTVWRLRTKSWGDALRLVGDRLNGFRSAQRTERFHDDRDLIRDYAFEGKEPARAPRRAAFGLPHNYFFKQTNTQVNVSGADHDRRASPLFIHLHELRGGEIAAVLSLIPARFLPEGEQVKIGPASGRGAQNVPPPPDFAPVRDFLSSLEALEVRI